MKRRRFEAVRCCSSATPFVGLTIRSTGRRYKGDSLLVIKKKSFNYLTLRSATLCTTVNNGHINNLLILSSKKCYTMHITILN